MFFLVFKSINLYFFTYTWYETKLALSCIYDDQTIIVVYLLALFLLKFDLEFLKKKDFNGINIILA